MHTDRDNGQPTIAMLLQKSASVLKSTSRSARLDAEVLLAHVMGRTRVQLYGSGTDTVKSEIAVRYIKLIKERRAGKPVAHLTGSREFWSMELQVTADTLIPRAETELLVECALKHIPVIGNPVVLEMGTGSGAVAMALATERDEARIMATDISVAALAVAEQNASSHNIENIDFCFGDWFSAAVDRIFDVIVSNPPYVTDDEWIRHHFELAHEPVLALRGGRDGLLAIRKIIDQAPAHLKPGGWLIIEHGFRQGPEIADLFVQQGFTRVSTYRDLPGHPRVTEGRLPTKESTI
jgi:release factor glutamine methyltransferase